MAGLTVQFLGSGDAFGSGGRLQACISVRAPDAHLLLDCGASSLIAMKRFGVGPLSGDTVTLSHLHGDHRGGLPFLVRDAPFSRRQRPLVVAGPPGARERPLAAMEVLLPGSVTVERRFEPRFIELPERAAAEIAGISVTAFAVSHAGGAPAYASRLDHGGAALAYSGDTAWTETLVDAAHDPELLIRAASAFEKQIKHHRTYATPRAPRERLGARRVALTPMSAGMLARRADVEEEVAEDGLTPTL